MECDIYINRNLHKIGTCIVHFAFTPEKKMFKLNAFSVLFDFLNKYFILVFWKMENEMY